MAAAGSIADARHEVVRALDRPRAALLGCVVALGLALVLVSLQPIRLPWWVWADPDGSYVGSSLNIVLGNHTGYLDHPGLPNQDALAIAFRGEQMAENAVGHAQDREAFVDDQFLHLDRTRPIYRTWAVLLYLAGVLLAFVCCTRIFGHWTWGLAGALLLLAAPGIAKISFLLRPDASLSALCLAIGYLTVTAFERRSAARYAAAATVLGLATMTKLTALGLVAPLALAALWRPATGRWWRKLAQEARSTLRRHRLWLVPALAAWVELCIVFNRERLPVLTNDDQRHVLLYGGTALGGFLACTAVAEGLRLPWANRIFSSFHSLLLLAFVAGLALPATLILDDGIQAVVAIWQSLTGGRVNESIEPFSQFSWLQFHAYPLHQAGLVMVLALIAAATSAWRRDYRPALLALGMLVLATLAAARYSYDYYYGPAYAVAIPGALWALRRRSDRLVPLHVWLVVLLVVVPSFRHIDRTSNRDVEVNAAAQRLADKLLKPGQVILAPLFFPIEDVRFDGLVDNFVDHVPDYPYRFLEAGSARISERKLTPRYYIAPAPEIQALRDGEDVELAGRAQYRLRPLPLRWGPSGAYGIAEILSH